MNTEEKRISRSLLTATSITQGIILVAYLLEVIKGERTIFYYLVLAALILIPAILSWMSYQKNPESSLCRYIGTIGYLIMYTMVLLTGDDEPESLETVYDLCLYSGSSFLYDGLCRCHTIAFGFDLVNVFQPDFHTLPGLCIKGNQCG